MFPSDMKTFSKSQLNQLQQIYSDVFSHVLLSFPHLFRKYARVSQGEDEATLVYRDTGVATDTGLITVLKCSFKGCFTDLFSHISDGVALGILLNSHMF